MAEISAIEWTDSTWNVVTGCTRVSDGCANCYIERTTPFRVAGRRFLPVTDGGDPHAAGATTDVQLHSERLMWPYRTGKRALGPHVFVNSLSDLFHPDIPDRYIASVFAVMADTPHLTYQVLTKRPARMRALLNSEAFRDGVADELVERGVATDAIAAVVNGRRLLEWQPKGVRYPVTRMWPLANVWMGVSVEHQAAADQRIPVLLDTDAAVRWLSCEPLLGPVDLSMVDWDGATALTVLEHTPNGIDWVVVGGESGPGARPMHPRWAHRIVRACADAGVAVFVKQMGAWTLTADADCDAVVEGARMRRIGGKGGDPAEWLPYLRVREFPDRVGA